MTVPTDETQTSSLFPGAIEEMKSKRPNHHVTLTTIGCQCEDKRGLTQIVCPMIKMWNITGR